MSYHIQEVKLLGDNGKIDWQEFIVILKKIFHISLKIFFKLTPLQIKICDHHSSMKPLQNRIELQQRDIEPFRSAQYKERPNYREFKRESYIDGSPWRLLKHPDILQITNCVSHLERKNHLLHHQLLKAIGSTDKGIVPDTLHGRIYKLFWRRQDHLRTWRQSK